MSTCLQAASGDLALQRNRVDATRQTVLDKSAQIHTRIDGVSATQTSLCMGAGEHLRPSPILAVCAWHHFNARPSLGPMLFNMALATEEKVKHI
jgi:hypothetical protein